jgi:hypothetical protein
MIRRKLRRIEPISARDANEESVGTSAYDREIEVLRGVRVDRT